MPYIDINPHKQRPKWMALTTLGLLAVVSIGVAVLTLSTFG